MYLLLILALIPVVLWALMYVFQGVFIFPGATFRMADDPAKPEIDEVQFVYREIGDERVEAWYVPAPEATSGQPAPLVVYFHGNGELIDDQLTVILGYRSMGVSILLPEYRGYGRSGGSPSQKVIIDDAAWFVEATLDRPEVDPDRVIYHGRSLGGAVAAALAERRAPDALILESTFTSIRSMAWRHGAPPFLVRHPFRTDQALARLEIPILLFHGQDDDIIPVAHGQRLRDIAEAREGRPMTRYVEYEGVAHNDFPAHRVGDYWHEVKRFVGAAATAPAESQE